MFIVYYLGVAALVIIAAIVIVAGVYYLNNAMKGVKWTLDTPDKKILPEIPPTKQSEQSQ